MIRIILTASLLSFLMLTTSNTWAAPAPKDVNIVNTPTVTVTNPQTSVTIDNAAGNPVPVTIQGGIPVASQPQFVGFSTNSVLGDVGLVGMHGECASTYGTGARMCLDIEVFKTPNLQPVPSVPSGWLQNTRINFSENDCGGWSTVGSSRAQVLSGERMNISDSEITFPSGVVSAGTVMCNQLRPVACCM